jgi:hypothetical protein
MEIEKLNNTIEMLSSKDKENHVVALSIIEETQQEDNLITLLLSMKLGRASNEEWKINAPHALDRASRILKKHNLWRDDVIITFHNIFTIIKATKQKPQQIILFMHFFTKYLTNQMQELGYDFIEEITIKIKE